MNQPIPASMLAKVMALEDAMRNYDQIELEVRHHFSPGVYARELHIPAGTVLTGKIHKYENLNILSQGSMYVVVGDEVKYVEAPFHIVSPPGTKRAALAQTDCVWTTIHGTDETDLAKIEAQFIAQDENDYIAFCERNKQLEHH